VIPNWLTLLVIAAAMIAVAGLLITIRTAMKFGQRRNFAPATGSEGRGIRYALFTGMMPWAKESARQHLPTYFVGIIYHLGIASGFLVLLATLLSIPLSDSESALFIVFTTVGAAAGLALLVKRAVTPSLRAISTPDDVLSNGLVTIFLIAAAATLRTPQLTTVFLLISVMLFLYIPLGKIRHCFLFFCSRISFGRFFGRRGVLPQPTVEVEDSHVGR
jgi:hypothetical protein